MCVVLKSAFCLFLATGGYNMISQTNTFFIDLNTKTFSPGPALIQSRSLHGCAAFEHNGRTIVMVAGGWNPNLNTTEFLDLSQDDPKWVLGPLLPSKMEELVLTYTDVGVLLIGGFDSTSIQDSSLIYRLVCNTDVISECNWQEFEHLAKAQSSPVVIPIPDSVDLCQNAITTTPQPLSS